MSTAAVAPRSRRVLLLGLVAVVVTALAIAVATAEPAGGQGPLPCDGGLYVTTGSPDDMTLTRVDQRTGALTPIGPGGLGANGIGHNPMDDYLYGIHITEHRIVRVGVTGEEVDLGVAAGTPRSWERTYVGTFLADGTYLVLGDNAPPTTPPGTVPGTWAQIDVSTSPPRVLRTFSHPSVGNNEIQDVALNPVDGRLYAHSQTDDRLVRIDPTTGAATPVGPVFDAPRNAGSAFFDSFGRLWLYGSPAGSNRQDTLFRVDDVTTDTPQVVSSGPAVTNSDGASCPFSLGMDKTVAPAEACAGDTVRYRFEITNQAVVRPDLSRAPREGDEVVSADLVDQLPPDGRTFVAGSLRNPLGGTPNDYGGSDRLEIEGLRIPIDTTAAITVDVALPADLAPGTVTNQARLVDISGNLGTEVRSEFPGTPELPDPTPLAVRSCPDLGVEKSTPVTLAGPGDEVAFAVRVTNHGPGPARDVDSIVDALPPGLRFRSASHGGTVSADGAVRWPAVDLDEGDHLDLTVTALAETDVRTLADPGNGLENVVTVAHPGDRNPANDRATAAVPVDAPDLVVDKDDGRRVVAPGQEIAYEIVVTNVGDGDAHGVVLTDRLPPGLTYLGGSEGAAPAGPDTVTWPAFDLPAGEARTFALRARVGGRVEHGAVVRNVANAPHPDDRNPDDNEDDDRNTVRLPPPPPPPTDDQPDLPWLPRTGAGIAAAALAGLTLLGGGLAARHLGRRRRR